MLKIANLRYGFQTTNTQDILGPTTQQRTMFYNVADTIIVVNPASLMPRLCPTCLHLLVPTHISTSTWDNSRGWWGAWYSPWRIRVTPRYCLNPLATMIPMTTKFTRAEDIFHKSWKTSTVNMTVSMVETQLCKLRSTSGTCVLYISFLYVFCELNLRYDY